MPRSPVIITIQKQRQYFWVDVNNREEEAPVCSQSVPSRTSSKRAWLLWLGATSGTLTHMMAGLFHFPFIDSCVCVCVSVCPSVSIHGHINRHLRNHHVMIKLLSDLTSNVVVLRIKSEIWLLRSVELNSLKWCSVWFCLLLFFLLDLD